VNRSRADSSLANVRLWTGDLPLEPDALQQIRNLAALPILARHVAVMPDVHVGKGATVGTVIPTRGAIIPAAVGVDIGCGMSAVRTNLRAEELPDSLGAVRAQIERDVPVGFAHHPEPVRTLHDGLAGHALSRRMKGLRKRFDALRIRRVIGRYDEPRMWCQVGSLGGGNHFVEIALDESGAVWLMLHSGSRHIGKTIGETAIGMARERAQREHVRLPDRDLAWLDEGSEAFEMYVEALRWAQDYAATNRDVMMHLVLRAAAKALGREIVTGATAVNCHHNYASVETHFGESVWVTRKGAVSARAGELGIIPGSMGAKSFIVRGKGNPDAYCSCSHGAGRRMSRGEAKRSLSLDDLRRETAGVECRKDSGVLDESPSAYKDIEAVMRAQDDLVEIVHTLKQVVCVKG
jgi:tRNA-splicing ligase RtcB